jgi:hypothetical protein
MSNNLLQSIDSISREVQNNGIMKIDNFLNQEDINLIEKIYGNKKNTKGASTSYIYRSKKKYFLLKNILSFKFLTFLNSLKMINLSKRLKLNELASKVLQKQTKLQTIDCYYSEISEDPVVDWHVDHHREFLNPNHYSVKFFVYLNDVTSNNGCLGYIPGSHKILYNLKSGIFNGKIKFKTFFTLKNLRELIFDDYYRNYLETKMDKKLIDNFLNQTNFINDDGKDTLKYDFSIKKGGALIFNESGVHRGSKITKNNRLVLRFLYKDIEAPD